MTVPIISLIRIFKGSYVDIAIIIPMKIIISIIAMSEKDP